MILYKQHIQYYLNPHSLIYVQNILKSANFATSISETSGYQAGTGLNLASEPSQTLAQMQNLTVIPHVLETSLYICLPLP